MRRYASEMAQLIGPQSLLIEYGSGASTKTRILIEAAQPAAYMPIDISRGLLMATAEELVDAYQDLHVVAVCADYSKPFRLPDFSEQRYRKRVIYFPGSTIGNFTPAETQAFFASVLTLLRAGDIFLVGVDLVKNPLVLHDAYNDAQGITAAFNLNVLQRINRELDANFDLSRFQHHAFYNATEKRIEMHLVSLVSQSVSVAQRPFAFDVGETIHTEISCKYSVGDFQSLARSCGMRALQVWVDQDQLFSVHCLAAA
jgi:dimethylhistidine N-methyltransferase